MLETAIRAAREAGKILRENHGKVRELKIKGGNWHEVVTNVDLESNKKIIEVIKSKFPEHNIISEETKQKKTDSPYCWYIDPIDGTTNYTLHFYYTCVGIGLAKDGELLLGVVYNPLMDELFAAEKGKGATLNGEPIKVSDNSEIKATVANFCHPNTPEEIKTVSRLFYDFKVKFMDLRRFGSAGLDLAWVACGRNDCFFHTNTTLAPWDFVGGVCILREAGGLVTDWEEKEWTLDSKTLLATNGKVHQEVLKMFLKCSLLFRGKLTPQV